MENTLTDTISIGFGILHPKGVGFFTTTHANNAKNEFSPLDPDAVDWAISKGKPAAFTKYLCITQYNKLSG